MTGRLLLCVVLLCLPPAASAAQRVVSLAPSLSEIMLELDAGELLVGVLDARLELVVRHLDGQLDLGGLQGLDGALHFDDLPLVSAARRRFRRAGTALAGAR